MNGIFISYRRQDAPGHAGRLYDRLRERFGRDRVFMDVSGSIEPGLAFDEVIEEAVGSCEALLVVIGDEWLTSADDEGRRRLDDPDDYLRLETATALERNIRVIPVLVARAEMPTSDDLPDDMKPLARRQAIELSDQRWDFDVDRLVTVLERVLEEDAQPVPEPAVGESEAAPARASVDDTESPAGPLHPGTAAPMEPEPPSSPDPDRVDPAPGPPSPTIGERWKRLPAAARAGMLGAVGLLAAWGAVSMIGGGASDLVLVPAVTGLSIGDAWAAIEDRGLVVGDTSSEPSDSLPPGSVLRQAPEAGGRVASGTAVKLITATAPSEVVANPPAPPGPSPADPGASGDSSRRVADSGATGATLPDFVGQRPSDAARQLRSLGLGSKLEYITTERTRADQVFRQDPVAGTPLGDVTRVRLTASQTPTAGARETGARYFAVGDPIFLDPPPTGGGRRAIDLLLRDGPYDLKGSGEMVDGLHLAAGPGVTIAPAPGLREPTARACADFLRRQQYPAIPVDESLRGEMFCVRTSAGTMGTVMIRVIFDPADEDGDRVLAYYWIWQ